jgi:DNA invertase Pin-like site-specific DNA recombinase
MQDQRSEQAVLYAAKSTVDKKGSNKTQLADGRSLAEAEGIEVVGEYADEDASAYTGNRGPELAAALDHAEQIGGSLIVQHSDRLARGDGVKARHLVQLVLEAKARGIRLRSKEDDSSLDSVLMAAAMGERNSEDSRRKGSAVSKGMARRLRSGKPIGGRSYGLGRRRNPETDELEIIPDPDKAPVVVRIYDEYLSGKTQQEIIKRLNAEGIPATHGGRWHSSTLRALLQNPVYAGFVRDGDELIEGAFEAIIPRERWDEAQRLREAKGNTYKRGRVPRGQHLFRKAFLRCACGAPIVPRTEQNNDGSLREIYVCCSGREQFEGCGLPQQRRAPIDRAVYAYFEQVGLDIEATRDQLATAVEHRAAEVSALLATAEREAASAAARVARVKDDYLAGDLTASEWRELRAELEPAAEAAEGARDRLAMQLAEVEAGPSLAGLEADLVGKLAQVRAAIAGEVRDAEGVDSARAALMRLFDHFVLHRGRPEQEAHLELIGEGYWIEPVMSDRAVKGYDEKLRPVLTAAPLDGVEEIPVLSRAGNGSDAENNLQQSFGAHHGAAALGGPFAAALAFGSGAGGIAYGLRPGIFGPPRRALVILGGLMVLSCLPLVVATSVPEMFVFAALSGITFAPQITVRNQVIQNTLMAGTATEAFTWAALATTVGASIGSALVGPLVEAMGWRAGAVVAVALPAVALLIVFARRDLIE